MLLLSLSLACAPLSAPQNDPAPTLAARIERLARPLVEGDETPGLVVAWSAQDGSTGTLALGRRGREDERPLAADALFEIGSLTKAFTGLCLARAAARGELALEDPLAALLPEGLRATKAAGLRLIDLATHTAGMPEIPTNLARDLAQFTVDYSRYGEPDLTAFLAGFTPLTPPGKTYLYSNAGFGLLGWGLARRAGKSFEELVRAEVIEPLGLVSTAITLTPELAARFATGHDPNGDPVPPMTFGVLGGCGALRADAADLLRFATAVRDGPERADELARAFELATTVAFRLPNGVGVTPGWNLVLDGASYLHDGQTAGFTSFVSFDRVHGTGVVVLANGSSKRVPELGVLVLRLLLGIEVEPPRVEIPARVPADELEALCGHYASPQLRIEVTRDRDHLYARIPGQAAFRLYPRNATHFVYRFVEATLDFERDGAGLASALVLHQNGAHYRCPRVGE